MVASISQLPHYNMKPCGAVSALLAAVVACLAYVLLRNSGQQEDSPAPGAYELGSGRMFDAIAPRYDLINKVTLCWGNVG